MLSPSNWVEKLSFSTVKSASATSNASRAGKVPSVTVPRPCHARSPLPSQPDVKFAGIVVVPYISEHQVKKPVLTGKLKVSRVQPFWTIQAQQLESINVCNVHRIPNLLYKCHNDMLCRAYKPDRHIRNILCLHGNLI